jgi:signal transduction histidine kinase
LLPAILGAEDAERGPEGGTDLPRSLRDWVVDLIFFGLAVLVGAGAMWGSRHDAGTLLLVIGSVLGVPACLALWVRRSHPLAVGVGAALLSAVSPASGGAALVGLFTVSVRCTPRRTLQVMVLSVITSGISAAIYRGVHYDWGTLAFGTVLTVGLVGFGLFVRVRRELVLSLHERARRAEDAQQLRMREAQMAERARIAREMHDVLAHRISLLSVHAGALEFNPDASREEISRAAGVIRASARAAQEELREVIGVLRAGSETEDVQPPQPTIVDLGRLIEEARTAGMDVSLSNTLVGEGLAPILGRTVYRLVQEALTNARKHAPGQVVRITVTGDHDDGVTVEVVNRPHVGRSGAGGEHVGAGMGLIGLAERVTLVGGHLHTETLPDGGFRVTATLPWGEQEPGG